jgi:pyruvate-ferredoxin/flavodoxin oxidoreductase
MKVYDPALLAGRPAASSRDYKGKEFPGWKFTVQVAPDDCTGCGCAWTSARPRTRAKVKHKAINMEPKIAHPRARAELGLLPRPARRRPQRRSSSTRQGLAVPEPLFEFSGACAGCGETPYVKLMTQLFGDRMLIANATGCSSIYGGNLPTTPYTANADGRGPAWSNSLFEDNAEFGLGFRLALDQQIGVRRRRCSKLAARLGDDLATAILERPQSETRKDRRAAERGSAELKRSSP